MEAVAKGLDKIGLTVRGLNGEGTESCGNMCQISNQSTLGESEERILAQLLTLCDEIVQHERNARARLLEQRRLSLQDHVGRALGILQNGMLLSFQEAAEMLSALRLGAECGLVRNLPFGRINETLLLSQPAHLQKLAGGKKNSDERDEIRAQMVRETLCGASLNEAPKRRRPRACPSTQRKTA